MICAFYLITIPRRRWGWWWAGATRRCPPGPTPTWQQLQQHLGVLSTPLAPFFSSVWSWLSEYWPEFDQTHTMVQHSTSSTTPKKKAGQSNPFSPITCSALLPIKLLPLKVSIFNVKNIELLWKMKCPLFRELNLPRYIDIDILIPRRAPTSVSFCVISSTCDRQSWNLAGSWGQQIGGTCHQCTWAPGYPDTCVPGSGPGLTGLPRLSWRSILEVNLGLFG